MPKLALLALLLLEALPVQAAGEFYCCQDPASSRRVCGDVLPEQCRGRAYRMFDSGGNLVKEVGPPLSQEQKAELILENKRKKQLEETSREQRRRDQALLDTYASPDDIDVTQQKAEHDVNTAVRDTTGQLDALLAKRRKLAAEAEFYRKKTMPTDLQRDLQASEHEIRLLQDLLALKRRDLDTIRAKFDADRKRYMELTGRRSAALPLTPRASSSAAH